MPVLDRMCSAACTWGLEDNFGESVLLLCGSWGLKSGHQDWGKGPLTAEPFCQPDYFIYLFFYSASFHRPL